MKNVTDEVFGSEPGKNVDLGDLLPVAFGDFNYDKFTDVFVVNKKRDTVKILLAKADALTSNHPSENTNGFQMVSNHLECQLTDMKIEAVLVRHGSLCQVRPVWANVREQNSVSISMSGN